MFRLSRFILNRYVAEQTFRFNERKLNDKERFLGVLKAVSGKRLTYDELFGGINRRGKKSKKD